MSIVSTLYGPDRMKWEVIILSHALLHNYAALRLLAPPCSMSL